MLTDINTQFVEHTIFIMKSILDNKKTGQPTEHLSTTSIEGLMLAIVKYVIITYIINAITIALRVVKY